MPSLIKIQKTLIRRQLPNAPFERYHRPTNTGDQSYGPSREQLRSSIFFGGNQSKSIQEYDPAWKRRTKTIKN